VFRFEGIRSIDFIFNPAKISLTLPEV